MSAFYDLYETPDPNDTGEKQPLHARIVPSGTYSKKDFIERVSRHQPFPHNIIEGVLGAVVDELAEALADGYIVELGELGHFCISLKCTHKVMTKKEIRAESIRFDNVHLRTSKEFKKKIKREIELERVENSKVKTQIRSPCFSIESDYLSYGLYPRSHRYRRSNKDGNYSSVKPYI